MKCSIISILLLDHESLVEKYPTSRYHLFYKLMMRSEPVNLQTKHFISEVLQGEESRMIESKQSFIEICHNEDDLSVHHGQSTVGK